MKASPCPVRKSYLRTAPDSENTPKRKGKRSLTRTKSPLTNSSLIWSSKKKSSKRQDSIREFINYENIQKELLEYQGLCNIGFSNLKGVARDPKFTEEEFLHKRLLLKCKHHEESYSFFSLEEKKLLCSKCLYNKYERLAVGNLGGSILPLEKCIEIINRENSHFTEIECPQYIRQLKRTISNCNHNNNFLMQKQEVLQGIVSTEFNNIYQLIKKREEELIKYINSFFDRTIQENIGQLQNFKFLLDNIQKIKEIGKDRNFEESIFQFCFSTKVKNALENCNLNVNKFIQKDLDFIGMENKDKIKREIEKLGRPLTKYLESMIVSAQNNTLRSSVDSMSPINFIKTNYFDIRTVDTDQRSSALNEKKSSCVITKRKPSQDYSNKKELSFLHNTDVTQFSHLKSQIFEDSNILHNSKLKQEALQLFLIDISKTRKLYSLSKDGASSQVFHRKCDNHGPYIIVVKTEGKNIFGYYNPLHFNSSDKYYGSEAFWIFSLKNNYNKSLVFKVKPEKNFIALYNSSKSPCLGSTIKGKEDLYIDFDNLSLSCSNISYAYKIYDPKIDGSKVLSGKDSGWKFDEIEVFHVDE